MKKKIIIKNKISRRDKFQQSSGRLLGTTHELRYQRQSPTPLHRRRALGPLTSSLLSFLFPSLSLAFSSFFFQRGREGEEGGEGTLGQGPGWGEAGEEERERKRDIKREKKERERERIRGGTSSNPSIDHDWLRTEGNKNT